jgi:formate dehydrogenase major subunit
VNRRIIYNRASVDLDGVPWDTEHPVIWWQNGGWKGDVPDGGWPPMAVDPAATKYPFIMKPEGHARIFGMGRADGPIPEHYEPWETPLVTNPLSGQLNDPAFKIWPDVSGRPQEKGTPDQYPIVATTYRVVEHWQAGQMTRNQPWLVELQPEMFVEISEELAAVKGITNGGKVIVETARGSVSAVAIVTKRFKPFQLNGKTVHQVGMPWHWGYMGLSTGDSANILTPHVGDANTMIPEFKAFLCNIRKV